MKIEVVKLILVLMTNGNGQQAGCWLFVIISHPGTFHYWNTKTETESYTEMHSTVTQLDYTAELRNVYKNIVHFNEIIAVSKLTEKQNIQILKFWNSRKN